MHVDVLTAGASSSDQLYMSVPYKNLGHMHLAHGHEHNADPLYCSTGSLYGYTSK